MDIRTRRLFEARRSGLVARVAAGGVGAERAERLADRWDDVAYSRGIGRLSPGYWSGAAAWIEEELAAERARRTQPSE
jgi:hypothetical protein